MFKTFYYYYYLFYTKVLPDFELPELPPILGSEGG